MSQNTELIQRFYTAFSQKDYTLFFLNQDKNGNNNKMGNKKGS